MTRGLGIELVRIGQAAPIQSQPLFPGLSCHPDQGNVSELARDIAAADIGVRTGKPDLLDLDTGRSLTGPERWHEFVPVLVDRQRVTSVLHHRARPGIKEAIKRSVQAGQDRSGHAESSNRIPY